MANLIQVKRSLTTAVPSSLANGEFAFTANGDVLYIGSNASVVAIGGKRTPGVLTANQALVANSTSYLDVIRTANLYIGSATVNVINAIANSTVLGAASNNELTTTWAIKTYVDTKAAASAVAGANTQVQFNNSGNFGASAGLTFDSVANNLTVANTITVANLVATTINKSPVVTVTLTGPVTGSGSASLTTLNSNTVSFATSLSGVNGVGLTSNSTVISVLANNGITANSTGVFVTAANGIITTDAGVNVLANNGITANSTGVFAVGANGISVTAAGINVLANTGIIANTSGVFTAQDIRTTASPTFQDLTLNGNLNVTGTLTTIDATNLTVNDSIIELARNNAGNTLDIGFFGDYNDGTARATGLIYRPATGQYELFANTTVKPTTSVNTTATGYSLAILKTYLASGALVSNSSAVTLTPNSTISVNITANTVSTDALNLSSIAAASVVTANSTGGLTSLSYGTDGQVLQMSGTSLAFGALDGGTF